MKSKKNSFLCLFLLLLVLVMLPAVFSLSITSDKGQYLKGEEMKISGECVVNDFLDISGESSQGMVFSQNIVCSLSGNFELKREIDFLDPSGEWFLKVASSKTETKTRILINQGLESSYYLITFLSPAPGKYKRTSDLGVTVKVTDSGRVISDANVVTWLFDGLRTELENKGNGVYSLDGEIPFDAVLGMRNLTIIAKSVQGNNNYGGENSIVLEIEKSIIEIDVLEPSARTFDITNTVSFEIVPYYFNNKTLESQSFGPTIVLQRGDRLLDFVLDEDGKYFLTYQPEQADLGNRSFVITASDEADNSGTRTINITFTCSPLCLVQSYGVYVLVVLVIILSFFALFYSRIKLHIDLTNVRSEKKKSVRLIRELQKEYFSKGVMSAVSYKRALAEYKAKIVEFEQKEKQLTKSKENM